MEASKTTQNKAISLVVIFFTLFLGFLSLPALANRKPASVTTTRNSQYTKALYFDVLGGSDMPQPFVEYELKEKGTQLKLGPIIIDEKTLSFGLRKLSDLDPSWSNSNETYFFVRWPEMMFEEAKIELLTRDGNVIWNKEVKKENLAQWKEKLRKELKNPKSTLKQLSWGTESSAAHLPLQGLADGFRFCISRPQQNAQERLCSQSYVVRTSGSQTLLGRLREIRTSRILVNGEKAADSGQVKVEAGMPIRFFAELATGETLEFTSYPLKVSWSDFTKLDGKEILSAVGFDVPPAGPYRILNPDRNSKLTKVVGFESTILDSRKFWAIQVKAQEPWLYFPGETGGVFRHPLPGEKAPDSRIRVHLDKRTPAGTYGDVVKLRGRKQTTTTVSSTEYRASASSNSEEFVWEFKASNNAKINKSSLLLSENGQVYKSYFEMYKGFANEFSARLSMILSTSGVILMGEGAYNHWFEDFFGWDNYYLAKQRWGISAKYFQSITKYKVSNYGNASLKVLNVDMKYRFTPGLWTRDESHGALFSYQNFDANLEITSFKVPMLGVGWFWARSMPKVFDDIFSFLPFMDYPKWVDMEFIYYAASMDSSKKLNLNFALNFHGQVLWKDNFFGEAGFGIKRYDVVDKTNPFQANLGYSLNTFYGTVGVGYKF